MLTQRICPSRFFPFVTLALLSCAGQVPPGGGPVDSIPPAVIRTEPDTNAVNVRTKKIVLEFSEFVDRRSAEESIFISPYVGQLEFDWSNRELTIVFSDELKKDRTYVLNLGTDVKDLRAQNRMAQGFTLAFSTGDTIDQGAISGRVFDDKPEGIMMFAYALDGMNADTLDPSRTKPDYIVQTGKQGSFAFSNIRFDTYRIFAVLDEYRNLVYDKQIDRFGVTTGDITVDTQTPAVQDIWFRLFAEDTAKPFLTRVVPLTQTHLLVRFSEPLDSLSFQAAEISLRDTMSHVKVGILLQSLQRSDSTLATVVTSTSLDSGRAYELSIRSVFDRAGNSIDTANASSIFAGVGISDTLLPGVELVGLRDSSRNVPLESSFELRFTRPVRQTPLLSAITLRDSVLANVPGFLQWGTASSVFFVPEKPLISGTWYSIRVEMDSVRDLAGNTFRDSVYVTRFQTLDLKTTGTIEGVVSDADTGGAPGGIILTASRVSTQTKKTLRLRNQGVFKFDQLPEGLYTLHAYRDRDSSMTYSFGRPFPFQPSERFVVYPDTVKVRARWGVEGISIRFKPEVTR